MKPRHETVQRPDAGRPHWGSHPRFVFGVLLPLVTATARSTDASSVSNRQPEWTDVQLHGAPTRYMVDVERYRFSTTPDVGNPAFYPIPQEPVNRDTYLRCIEEMQPAEIARNPHRGMDGPRAFMPVLVKYVQTGDATWAEACMAMLKAFQAEMQKQVAERKWFWQFEHPAALIPLYHKYLIQGGAMKEDANWFREMWLCYCRNLHVWDSEPVEWRGGCHRSMPEGYAKGRAAAWYPDIPEAAHWKRYSELVFNDFWKAKDGLNVRSPKCPGDVFDFRTCEGVVVGSKVFGLFQVKLPTTFGDGFKSLRRDGNTWSYAWLHVFLSSVLVSRGGSRPSGVGSFSPAGSAASRS